MAQSVADAERPRPRLINLDLLRLAAVLLVLGRHMDPPPENLPAGWGWFLTSWRQGGWVGVDLFFVLSGFLVSGLLFGEFKSKGRFSIGRFYARRGWKIYPPFLALIAFTVAFRTARHQPVPLTALATELLFLQSYFAGIWTHTWSLAVEEHFYLLLPAVLVFVGRRDRGPGSPFRAVPTLAAVLAVYGLCARVITLHYRPEPSDHIHSFASHLRLDSLFFGVAISHAYHFHPARFTAVLGPWRWWLIIIGASSLLPAFVLPMETSPFILTAGYTVFYFGAGSLLVGILLSRPPQNRVLALLATLGAYSYSTYLWHLPVAYWAIPMLEEAGGVPMGFLARFAIYIVGSFAAGVVMAHLVEIPALRLRDRLSPRRDEGAIEAITRGGNPE